MGIEGGDFFDKETWSIETEKNTFEGLISNYLSVLSRSILDNTDIGDIRIIENDIKNSAEKLGYYGLSLTSKTESFAQKVAEILVVEDDSLEYKQMKSGFERDKCPITPAFYVTFEEALNAIIELTVEGKSAVIFFDRSIPENDSDKMTRGQPGNEKYGETIYEIVCRLNELLGCNHKLFCISTFPMKRGDGKEQGYLGKRYSSMADALKDLNIL